MTFFLYPGTILKIKMTKLSVQQSQVVKPINLLFNIGTIDGTNKTIFLI